MCVRVQHCSPQATRVGRRLSQFRPPTFTCSRHHKGSSSLQQACKTCRLHLLHAQLTPPTQQRAACPLRNAQLTSWHSCW